MKYYAYCPACNNFWAKGNSLSDAKQKLEQHEKDCHKGKQVGTFGVGNSYPKEMPKEMLALSQGL